MTSEDLNKINSELPTVNIKGKEYVMVKDRVAAFRKICPNGSIVTEIISNGDGAIIMKATVKDGDVILSTGTAWEKESSSYINKTSYIENCVPEDTEILTEDGWKYHYQLNGDEKVYSANLTTGKIELTDITGIVYYENAPLVRMKTSRFDFRCTPEHKWVVTNQGNDVYKQITKDLRPSERILQNIPQTIDTSTPAADEGRKLGWLMCDCEITRTKNGMPSTACISQAKHVEEIKKLFGEPTNKCKKYDPSWMDCYEWVIPGEQVRIILGKYGISTYADLSKAMLKADIEYVAGCYEAMMLADGESRGFSSTYKDLVDAVQIMCIRLGYPTGKIRSRMMPRSTRPIYTLTIKKSKGTCVSELVVTNEPPRKVWCPKTGNTTWFMRQGDMVTLTSNCETSCIGRALGFAGIGVDDSMASAEEVANAMLNQNKKTTESPKITTQDVEAIISACKKANMPVKTLLNKYNVSKLEDLTIDMYTNSGSDKPCLKEWVIRENARETN